MQEAAKFWDKTAAKYAKSPIADEKSYAYTLGRTQNYLSRDDRALEVGCGTGSTALLLAEHVQHMTASDISPNMIQIARQKAKDQAVHNITFTVADITANTTDEAYDVVLAHNILHLLEDIPTTIRHLTSLLKPGGLFISKTVCLNNPSASFKYWLLKTILPLMQMIGKAPHVSFLDKGTLEQLIRSAGFDLLETGDHPAPSRYIVARKK